MSVSHEQIEGIIDQALHQQKFYRNADIGGTGKYEQIESDVLDDLENQLPSPLKLDSSGYAINGTTISLDADLGGAGSYDITTARTGAAEYHGVEFDIEKVLLAGTIEVSEDPRESNSVEVVDSDVEYIIRGSASPY
jgi:hypothetical protein